VANRVSSIRRSLRNPQKNRAIQQEENPRQHQIQRLPTQTDAVKPRRQVTREQRPRRPARHDKQANNRPQRAHLHREGLPSQDQLLQGLAHDRPFQLPLAELFRCLDQHR